MQLKLKLKLKLKLRIRFRFRILRWFVDDSYWDVNSICFVFESIGFC